MLYMKRMLLPHVPLPQQGRTTTSGRSCTSRCGEPPIPLRTGRRCPAPRSTTRECTRKRKRQKTVLFIRQRAQFLFRYDIVLERDEPSLTPGERVSELLNLTSYLLKMLKLSSKNVGRYLSRPRIALNG